MLAIALLAAALLVHGPTAEPPRGGGDAAAAARAYWSRSGHAVVADLAAFLALPNTPADPTGLRATAEHARALLAERGATVELVGLPGDDGVPPLVLGRLDAPGATRTLGLYVHYDGQPVQPERWTFGPWTPTLTTAPLEAGGEPRALPRAGEPIDDEWRLYARSAGDDKAPIIALAAALDALDAAGIARTTNLVFAFEGEEESGSTHLGDYFAAHRARLAADLWLVLDGPVHPTRRPQLVFGVRGVTSLELTVYGASHGLHSGHYGNWAPNPAMELARLLASMKDGAGRVLVEGFYDDVAPLGATERAALAALPVIDEALKEELALTRTEGSGTLQERLLLPSLNVRGLSSAAVGAGARNIVPAEATAALDLRLVAGNDPVRQQERVEAHVRAQGYHVVRAEPDRATRLAHGPIARITRGGGYRAARTPLDHPLVPHLVAAIEAAAGEPPLLVPSLGGSLPLYLFEEVLDTPMIVLPIANHDDGQHAPDENLRLGNLAYGVALFAELVTLP